MLLKSGNYSTFALQKKILSWEEETKELKKEKFLTDRTVNLDQEKRKKYW